MRFKTMRGEDSKEDNLYKRRPGLLKLVSETVPGQWWGKPDGGENLSEDAESQEGVTTHFKTVKGKGSKADNFYKRRLRLLHLVSESTRFKTVRGEGSKWDNFFKRRPGMLQLVSELVPGRWWGKLDGGANLSEDAKSQGGTRFKTVRGEGSKEDNFYKQRPGLLQLVSEPVLGWWWGKPQLGR
ncbi:hypothetical protein HAX54_029432 [Datura stramonium]|uniref:Uncharacterized protein n=1 Tax=Datura stramonium TaxID=4076 RepID=A0ABS8V5X4_DATST|nr:hypothetical protein [Datura stramonium]